MMTAAARRAGGDVGPGVLDRLGWIGVPKGAWTHPDPGREVAAAVGAPGAHTVLAEVGITQQEVIDIALTAVRDGAGAALVVGAEVNHGSTAGAATAVGAARRAAVEPDEHLISHDLGVSAVEMNQLFVDPPTVYAVLENAFAAARGWDDAVHRRRLGDLTEAFAGIAAWNSYAWQRDAPSAEAIVEPSADNRMIADPYTKLCCSNLRVNQAAALLFMTVAGARAARIPENQWLFPLGTAFCNHAVPVVQRPDLGRSVVARLAGQRAMALAKVGPDDLDHLDLYSCFPAAVQITAGELGIPLDRQLTVTGGMTFAGGPLNSYVLHAMATMAEVLRNDPAAIGLVTSVSGFLTKFGAGVWSTDPARRHGWRHEDVTAEADALGAPMPDTDDPGDDVAVVAGTVTHARDGTRTRVEVVETPRGVRALRSTPL
jgi:acetyl-CoA C-acetyltransferase